MLWFPQPFLYEILVLGGVTGHPVWLELMSICGVMRCFRLYAQFHQVRVIILALVRTFKVIGWVWLQCGLGIETWALTPGV